MCINKTNLFERALIDPIISLEANKLFIVSGFATALMAMRHIESVKRIGKDISIDLIYGMCSQEGIEKKNHLAFVDLQSKKFGVNFKCDYIVNRPPVHSKVYAWFKNDEPVAGFIGSANYTQNAFSNSMREVLAAENPVKCFNYYNSLLGETVNCGSDSISDIINIFEKKITRIGIEEDSSKVEAETAQSFNAYGLQKITLTLLGRDGQVPSKSGLNWGQRDGREHNQAYLNIPAEIGRSGFFPDRYESFTVTTDDNKPIICVRAQDGGKGLHSTLNNSLLGEYFRYRLGLANGEFITKDHLLHYGRTDVDFYKIDEENYIMDFSVR